MNHSLTQGARSRAAVLALAAALVSVPASHAAERLPSKPFVYDAQQTALTDLLRDFAGSIGVPIVIADGVTGTVNAKFSIAPTSFLDLMGRSFGLIWYHDGTALHVYPSSQIRSRIFRMPAQPSEAVRSRLQAFGLLDDRYPVRVMEGGPATLVFASGPPRHLELVEALLASTEGEIDEPQVPVTRAFQLVHASAVDRTLQGTVVPGVASLLAQFFGGRQGAGAQTGAPADPTGAGALVGDVKEATESMVASAASLVGTPESRARRSEEIRNAATSLKAGGAPLPPPARGTNTELLVSIGPAAAGRATAGPLFLADEATNQILVRGAEAQMADIEAMIARLDVPRDMIEVEATIIDVSSDEIDALGFDWGFRGDGAVRSLDLSSAVSTTTTSGAIPQGGGHNITTLLASGGKELLARIRALEAKGTARVVSQPKVLGAANRTAVLSDKRTASVRVAGNQDARLYSVETGTTLRVTPRVIQQGEWTRIGMDLLIEDGGFSTQSVDDVPIAQRTTITTIATLNEGQALLVGGIEVEGASQGSSGIPGLSRLPLVGGMFRYDATQAARRQRLFLITPKRVQLSRLAAAAPDASTQGMPARAMAAVEPTPTP